MDLNRYKLIWGGISAGSGALGSWISSTKVFFGNAWEEYGPRYALAIAVIWFVTFAWVILRKEPKEPEPTPAGYGQSTQPSKPKKHLNYLKLMIIPWALTFMLWGRGVYLHERVPRVLNVVGTVQYGEKEQSLLVGDPVADVKVKLEYAGQEKEVMTDENGFFDYLFDVDENSSVLRITYTKKNHTEKIKSIDIGGKSLVDASIDIETSY